MTDDDVFLETLPETPDILFLASPLARTGMPVLGLHLLQACCRDAGLRAAVFYSNLFYSRLIGPGLHKHLGLDEHLMMRERVFAPVAYGLPVRPNADEISRFTDPSWAPDHIWRVMSDHGGSNNGRSGNGNGVPQFTAPYREWAKGIQLERLRTISHRWLEEVARRVASLGVPIVGCSTSLGGLAPAIALLRVIKNTAPGTVTILGGTHCEGAMAKGIRSLDTGIDHIFSGEGEITFPVTAGEILAGRPPAETVIYGETVNGMDRLPVPDFHDYSLQRSRTDPSWAPGNGSYVLPFESSRGCWYGKCTFCGLKEGRSKFRSKSPEVLIRQLEQLAGSQEPDFIAMADPMMPWAYFKEVVPFLAEKLPGTRIIYEMRADLGLEQVLALKDAGIIIRPGLESLSGGLLELMDKPYSLEGNIALLRYARIAGMDLDWALLLGLPGDRDEHYREMIRLLPLIRHLQPPSQMEPLKLVRYSEYLKSPGTYGITGIQPAGVYREILPPGADLDNLAFFYTGDFPSQCRQNPQLADQLWEEFQAWTKQWQTYRAIPVESFLPALHITRKSEEQFLLEDTRGLPGRPRRRELSREEAQLLLVSRPMDESSHIRRALDNGLGIAAGARFIPLATAPPELLLQFEKTRG